MLLSPIAMGRGGGANLGARRTGCRRAVIGGAALAALVGAASCGASSVGDGCPAGACHGERTVTEVFQNVVARDLDVLFVVDDGPASAALSAGMAAVYPRMAQVLQSLTPYGVAPGSNTPAAPSLHVAFVPASHAGAGACLPSEIRAGACGVTPTDQFLSSAACGLQPNFAGSWEDAFSCLAAFGSSDCDPAQPLAAMRRALGGDARGGALEGRSAFSRESAFLQIVIVSAQDDVSGSPGALEDVTTFASFVKTLKSDPARVAVSVIGPSSDCAAAAPPEPRSPRLVALVEAFGSNGLYVPSCSASPLEALMTLATRLAILTGIRCVAGVRDTDLAVAGVQPSCAVDESAEQIDGSFTQATLPSCDRAAPPCWRLTSNPASCPGALVLDVDRGPGWCPELSTTTQVSCVGCLDASDPTCAPP
jgi:hypothetical protein